jgi:hypothetical protein
MAGFPLNVEGMGLFPCFLSYIMFEEIALCLSLHIKNL